MGNVEELLANGTTDRHTDKQTEEQWVCHRQTDQGADDAYNEPLRTEGC